MRHALASLVLLGGAASAMPAFALPTCIGTFTSAAAAGTSTGSIVQCTIDTTGTYDITAYAASGGEASSGLGGLGAEVGGSVTLTANTVLDILVGVAGGNSTYHGAGGGGGTFVVTGATSAAYLPLVVAGGGGGAGLNAYSGTTGLADLSTNPNGGEGYDAGGGSGYSGNGNGGAGDGGGGGLSFLNGGTGGGPDPYVSAGSGGFGGGGGAANSGGGGGGYQGGDGNGGGTSGGGGRSYLDPSVTELVGISGENSGNGEVVIGLLSPIPEPASAAILGFGVLGLAVNRRRAR